MGNDNYKGARFLHRRPPLFPKPSCADFILSRSVVCKADTENWRVKPNAAPYLVTTSPCRLRSLSGSVILQSLNSTSARRLWPLESPTERFCFLCRHRQNIPADCRSFAFVIRYDDVTADGARRVLSFRMLGPLEDGQVWAALRWATSAIFTIQSLGDGAESCGKVGWSAQRRMERTYLATPNHGHGVFCVGFMSPSREIQRIETTFR